MIDMHSHCLPGIDDGARTVEEAVHMLEEAWKNGTDRLVATPHCRVYDEAEIDDAVRQRDEAYNTLSKELRMRKSDAPIIRKGFEVYLDADITQLSNYRKLCIGQSDYMLVELPFARWDAYTIERIRVLKEKGITPIIAHPERYSGFYGNIDQILSEKGIVCQVNAGSFFDFKRFRAVKKILKNCRTCVIGSDMHDEKIRVSQIHKAVEKMGRKRINPETAFYRNAEIIWMSDKSERGV